MANLHQVLGAFQQQLVIVTTGLSVAQLPLRVEVGVHWPPIRTLQYLVKLHPPGGIISVFDRKSAHDSTRWIPSVSVITSTPPTLVSSPSTQNVPPGGSGTVTVSGPVTAGDALSLFMQSAYVMSQQDQGDGTQIFTNLVSQVVSPPATASPPDVVSQMVAAVAANPTGPATWATVTGSGSVITVVNNTQRTFSLQSYTGNGGTQITEIARRIRQIQITVWAPTSELINVISNPVEDMIAQIETFRGRFGEYAAGLTFEDGTTGWVKQVNDFLVDDSVLSDLYRHDFIVSVDYGVTTVDNLYSVLVPVESLQPGYHLSQ